MAGDDRPAFYALRPGGWRDYVTLLHPPYTAWHLSYVAIGAAASPRLAGGRLGASVLAFVVFGAFIVLAYNLELAGGRFHSDTWFAISWGAFPSLTGYFAQAATIRWQAVLVALGCLLFSAAQRRLSTPVRRLRRRVTALEGRMILADGTEVAMDEAMLRAAPEAALRAIGAALPLLAAGLVTARLL